MAQKIHAILLLLLLTQSKNMLPHSLGETISHNNNNTYLEDACSVTRYRDVCIQSLSSFSNTAKDNPRRWARAGVSVTIAEAKRAAQYLAALGGGKNGTAKSAFRGRNKIAVADCAECFGDALYNLHRSLRVLRRLTVEGFVGDMEDVTTWVSAALTDEGTCLDGFNEGGQRRRGKRVGSLISRISRVSYMTSNALALINKLATTGP